MMGIVTLCKTYCFLSAIAAELAEHCVFPGRKENIYHNFDTSGNFGEGILNMEVENISTSVVSKK